MMNDEMDPEKMKMIMKLMDGLQDQMQYGKDDLASRLGRKTPDVAIMKVEGKMDPEMMDKMKMMGKDDSDDDSSDPMAKILAAAGGKDDADSDDSMGDDSGGDYGDHSGDDDQMSPEDMLKARLMKMRG